MSIKDFHLLKGAGTQTPVITITGTSAARTQVTLARNVSWCMILRPSFSIFISSLV